MPENAPHAAFATLKPRFIRLIVIALLALIGGLLFASARQESQTFDEANHLFAGFEYWKHGDFGRNPEHPPLVKLLAAIPLLPMGLKEPSPIPIPTFKLRDFLAGAQFLYTADADAILLRGRMVIAIFSLVLALLVFCAAREMFDPVTGIVALGLFAFEPVLLANGALVTTDMALACLFFASVYSFYRYTNKPSPSRLAVCVIATALAIVTKHSGILILPTLILLAFVDLFIISRLSRPGTLTARQYSITRLRQCICELTVIGLTSYLVIWAIYCFRYAARPGQLQMVPTLAAYSAGLTSPLQRFIITLLAHHHMFPEAYLYGWVDILRIPGNRSSFIFEHVISSGKWFFFPAIFLIKSTLTLLVFLILLPFACISGFRRELLFLSVPVAFFALASISSMLNLGVRHILPIYPFCIVLGAVAASSLVRRSGIARAAVAALMMLTVVSSLHAYPDYLAYSNEIAGGPSHTYRLVSDSNADWGQGLKWAKTYLDHHPTADCWFDYYNPTIDPAYYGIHCKPLLSGVGHTFGFGTAPIPATITGTVLISATEVVGLKWGPDILNPYQVFLTRAPDAIIYNNILVYRGTFDVSLLAAQTNAAAAMNLARQHRLPEAIALAQTAAEQAPNSAEVSATLGQVLLASNHIAEGRKAIANAVYLAKIVHPEFQKSLIDKLQHVPIASH